MSWNEYDELMANLDEELREIVNDFENCGSHDLCEKCKCYERLNGTQCTICDLLLTYRGDLSNRITELIDNM